MLYNTFHPEQHGVGDSLVVRGSVDGLLASPSGEVTPYSMG
jgi:hypothetical protein